LRVLSWTVFASLGLATLSEWQAAFRLVGEGRGFGPRT